MSFDRSDRGPFHDLCSDRWEFCLPETGHVGLVLFYKLMHETLDKPPNSMKSAE